MNKIELKNKLLSTELFIDNQYLDEYLNLIIYNNYDTLTNNNHYFELHHVLPISYYKHTYKVNSKEATKLANNDLSNLIVPLTYANHCKAHYLIYLCTTGYLKAASKKAVLLMINVINNTQEKNVAKILLPNAIVVKEITEKEFEQLQEYADKISKKWKKEKTIFTDFWTKEKDLILKQLIEKENKTYLECANILGCSSVTVNKRANLLKISKRHQWTDEDDKFILENENKISINEIARVLNVKKSSIMSRREYLGLKQCKRGWTDEEISWLIENSEQLSISELVEHFGKGIYKKSKDKIKEKCIELGINWKNKRK